MSANKSSRKKKKNKAVQEAPIESIRVKLKPVLGIQPRAYVPAVWAFIILLIIFLLLVLPGIRKNGTHLTVESIPADASIIVDDIRLGSSGDEVFVPRGSRNLLLRRRGFQPFEENIEVSGRIFASRLFLKKRKITVTMKPDPEFDFLSAGLIDFAHWSATGPEKDRYAIPPVLTRTGRDLLSTGYTYSGELADAALPLSRDERQLADILRGEFMLSSGGAPVGMNSIVSFIDKAAEKKSSQTVAYLPVLNLINSKHLKLWDLDEAADEMRNNRLALVSAYKDEYNRAISSLSFPAQLLGGRKFITFPALELPVGDMEAVSSGYVPRSGAIPVMASLEPFYISSSEVSNSDFAVFLSEVPGWSAEDRETLVTQGLADESYLSDWGISGYPTGTARNPVREVSWYAAEAYTSWFTQRYLQGSGLTARLPREDQWEVAARLNRIPENSSELPSEISEVSNADSGTLGITGMAGNVREWALNPYRENENLFRSADGSASYQSPSDPLAAPDRPVRGGAFIDRNLPYPAAVRGGLSPETTSPVIGFRLALVHSTD